MRGCVFGKQNTSAFEINILRWLSTVMLCSLTAIYILYRSGARGIFGTRQSFVLQNIV